MPALDAAEAAALRAAQTADAPVLLVDDCAAPEADEAALVAAAAASAEARGAPPPAATPAAEQELQEHAGLAAASRERLSYTRGGIDHAPLRRMESAEGRREAAAVFEAMGRVVVGAAGLRVLELPAGTDLFKGTHYFYDGQLAEASSAQQPYMWVGNAKTAVTYAQMFSGGVMAYATARPLRLLYVDAANCRRLYDSTPWRLDDAEGEAWVRETYSSGARAPGRAPMAAKPDEKPDEKPAEKPAKKPAAKPAAKPAEKPAEKPAAAFEPPRDPLGAVTRAAFETKWGAGISLPEQARRVRAYNKLVPGEPLVLFRTRRRGRFTGCIDGKLTREFGAGANDRVVADALRARAAELGIDGWYAPETYSPFHCALSQELLLFCPEAGGWEAALRLQPQHPLHWRSWLSRVPGLAAGLLPTGEPSVVDSDSSGGDRPFDLSSAYRGRNRAFRVVRHVVSCEGDSAAARWRRVDAAMLLRRQGAAGSGPAGADRLAVLLYDATGLRSPNAAVDRAESLRRCVAMLRRAAFGPSGPSCALDVAVLLSFPESELAALRSALPAALPGFEAHSAPSYFVASVDEEPADASELRTQHHTVVLVRRGDDVAHLPAPTATGPRDVLVATVGPARPARPVGPAGPKRAGAKRGWVVACAGMTNGWWYMRGGGGATRPQPPTLFAAARRANAADRAAQTEAVRRWAAPDRRVDAWAIGLGGVGGGGWLRDDSPELEDLRRRCGADVDAYLAAARRAGAADAADSGGAALGGTGLSGQVEDFLVPSAAVELAAVATVPHAEGPQLPVVAVFERRRVSEPPAETKGGRGREGKAKAKQPGPARPVSSLRRREGGGAVRARKKI